jgi:hypothetical protein
MLLKTINRAPQWRLSALAVLTLAAFITPAIPATASANTDPHSFLYGQYNSPPGNVFINDVKAVARTRGHRVFNVKFQFRVGAASGVVSAVNRATALTTCAGCRAVAIGFQVVTTTAHDLAALHVLNVATADTTACAPHCNAVADAYQVVVATDTPDPMSFGWFLSPRQMSGLSEIRAEFLALPSSGLTMSQVQRKCEDLVDQATDILQSGSDERPDHANAARPFRPRSGPIVKVYRDIRFDRHMAR